MAAKRITQSSINWSALAERVPPNQKTNFIAFKTRSDKYLRAVLAHPEQSPAIDWAQYQKTVAIPGLVDTFRKAYEGLKVPYPVDTLSAKVEEQRKEVSGDIQKFKADSEARIAQHKAELERISALLPYDQMTLEEFKDAHPDLALDPLNKPTFWPHEPEDQLDYVPPKDAPKKVEDGH